MNHGRNGNPKSFDDLLEDAGKAAKRQRKALWNNMKKSVALQVI